jgi:hypothetical protein
MRILAISALLIFSLGLVGQQDVPKPRQQKKESKDQGAQPQPATPPPEVRPSTPPSAPAPQAEGQTPKPEVKPFFSHGEWAITSLTAIYVLISFFSFKAIKRQADIGAQAALAAQDAARAAERNTDALINIERPFLLVTNIRYDLLPITTADGRFQNASHVHVTFKNFGHSPAWAVALGGSFRAFAKPSDLPTEPEYGTTQEISTYSNVFPPGEDQEVLSLALESPESDFTKVIAGELFWFAYGFIRYRDIFGRIHETRFCVASSRGNAIVFRQHPAPPSYNQHT